MARSPATRARGGRTIAPGSVRSPSALRRLHTSDAVSMLANGSERPEEGTSVEASREAVLDPAPVSVVAGRGSWIDADASADDKPEPLNWCRPTYSSDRILCCGQVRDY
jgi:hypothetical protein